ncbi:O-glucosyltransferase rumi isoform X1 [Setaria italica]|uniref:O-glucosyltransferase rumi isoform X1 n=1 Tax=Setaria italica TaxID=4555 RepID=UPI000351270B|nr:O-glucosyltransferase rumi isoform X1 [Setaria italica]
METAAAKAARLARSSLAAAAPCPAANGGVVVFFAALVAGALVTASWMYASARLQVTPISPVGTPTLAHDAATGPEPAPAPPRFTDAGTKSTNQTPANFAPPPRPPELPPAPSPAGAAAPAPRECPAYFRWIHEDLRPWRDTGVTLDAVEGARRFAPKFRVTVVAGRLYVARYGRCFQTRDVFTQWGILQLLRRYPGRVPNLDLMFDCDDLPVVGAADRHHPHLPPLFRYCGSEATLDIAFPDWSFWGWPELNIKPWEALRREIEEGNTMVKWTDRSPYAYWKGNPNVGAGRRFLLRCNASGKRDWNARIYAQDWGKELRQGFRESDLSKQCTHRYKIYIEGRGWSVSEKYILACDSVALMVRPRFHDFFSRGLAPLRHYWPVVRDRGIAMCRSIKFAVDWGNAHTDKAREIGGNASRFVREDLAMDRVYDYMFHLLSEYARLLRYRPAVPRGAAEVTVESMMRGRRGLVERQFMMDTVEVDGAGGEGGPCRLQPPFSAQELEALRKERADVVRQVEAWENH